MSEISNIYIDSKHEYSVPCLPFFFLLETLIFPAFFYYYFVQKKKMLSNTFSKKKNTFFFSSTPILKETEFWVNISYQSLK